MDYNLYNLEVGLDGVWNFNSYFTIIMQTNNTEGEKRTTMKKHTITLAAVAAFSIIAMTGCGGGSGDDGDPGDIRKSYPDVKVAPYPAPPISEAQKAEFLNAVNAARSQEHSCGQYGVMPPAPPLAWSDILYRAAAEHSFDMASTGIMTHDGSGSETDWTMMQSKLDHKSSPTERGIANGAKHGIGENVARGYSTTTAVIQAWLNSPGHCRQMMDPNNKSIGMARTGSFWTQAFSWYDPSDI